MASAVRALGVAPVSAQTAKPNGPEKPVLGVPTTLGVIPGLPTAPGRPPTTGVTLEQAQAAIKALAAPHTAAAAASDSSPALAAGGITAVFMAPAGVLAAIGTAQDDSIVVSRDADGRLLVNRGIVAIQGGRRPSRTPP